MGKRIPQSALDEVLARTDIRAVVEAYVKLQRKGGRFFGLCPFHDEKTPSFSVSPDRGFFYCFGCSASGNAIHFLERAEGWSFPETVRELARRAGVDLPEEDDRAWRRRRSERDAYYDLMEMATAYFEGQLRDPSNGAAARAYLEQRALGLQTAALFRLGYAPSGWDGLLRHMRRNKVSDRAVERAGLALARKSGDGYYDRFRDRLMFPVTGRLDKVVGFSGRALGPTEGGKYVNSPELEFFKKGEHLYGIQAAKPRLRTDRQALVVEGNFDVVTLYQAGFEATVAPLGTALTERQVGLLQRVCDSVVLLFDGDAAGRKAMMRCLPICYQAGLDVRAALLPEGTDPDSYVREQGAEALRQLVDRARPLAEVALDRVLEPAVGGSPERRVRAARKAGELLAALPKGAIRRAYQEDVARRLELRPADVGGRAARPAADRQAEREQKPGAHAEPLGDTERMLVQLMVDEPRLALRLRDEVQLGRAMVPPPVWQVAERLGDACESGAAVPVERLVGDLEEPLRRQVLEAVSVDREYLPEQREAMMGDMLWQLHLSQVRRRKRRLAEAMRAAEREADEERLVSLLEKDRQLTQELMTLQRRQVSG